MKKALALSIILNVALVALLFPAISGIMEMDKDSKRISKMLTERNLQMHTMLTEKTFEDRVFELTMKMTAETMNLDVKCMKFKDNLIVDMIGGEINTKDVTSRRCQEHKDEVKTMVKRAMLKHEAIIFDKLNK